MNRTYSFLPHLKCQKYSLQLIDCSTKAYRDDKLYLVFYIPIAANNRRHTIYNEYLLETLKTWNGFLPTYC